VAARSALTAEHLAAYVGSWPIPQMPHTIVFRARIELRPIEATAEVRYLPPVIAG
jgi:hypothetical protein